jgi:hypothetical protein
MPPVAPPASVSVQAPPPVFSVRSYLGKCLDFGQAANPVSQVVIFDCNGSASQHITVEEVDSQHDVVLHAGSQVLGVNSGPLVATLGGSNTVPTGGSTIVYGLELQARNTLTAITAMGQRNQVFVLDGDSMILASNRNLVVQVQNGQGANGSPVVVAQRNLADSEFWDFNAIDGSSRFPTSGFATATTADELSSLVSTASRASDSTGCSHVATCSRGRSGRYQRTLDRRSLEESDPDFPFCQSVYPSQMWTPSSPNSPCSWLTRRDSIRKEASAKPRKLMVDSQGRD